METRLDLRSGLLRRVVAAIDSRPVRGRRRH